jgi:hypothetical protein
MKTLIIHPGLPKTGTSALQVFFARNRAALRDKSVDYFPLGEFAAGVAGGISAGNAAHLATALMPADHPDAAPKPALHFSALTRAIAASPCQTGLLSSEFLAGADPERLRRWVDSLQAAGLTVRCVYFIRSQTQLLSSMYVQYVKRSLCRETPEAYVERSFRATPYLHHASFYKSQCDIFGAGNVTLRLYEDALKTGLIETFLEAAGICPRSLDIRSPAINTGLSPAELAIMRELNKFRPHTRLSDALTQNARQSGSAAPGDVYAFLPAALTAELEAYFAPENAELAKLYFGREELFPAAATAVAPNDKIGEVSQTDLVNVLGGLLVRYDERLAYVEAQLAAASRSPLRRLARAVARAAPRLQKQAALF